MHKLTIGLFLAISSAAFAADVPPTEASVKELLSINGSTQVVSVMTMQLTAYENGAVQQTLQGHPITPEIKKILDKNASNTSSTLKESLKWEAFEPIYVQIYQSLFTQDEVDGIVAFYKSPAGLAMVKKTPSLMQASMGRMQVLVAPITQKLQQIQQQTLLQIQAENAKHS